MESVRGACLTTMTTQISINVNKVAITVYRDLCVSVSRRRNGVGRPSTPPPPWKKKTLGLGGAKTVGDFHWGTCEIFGEDFSHFFMTNLFDLHPKKKPQIFPPAAEKIIWGGRPPNPPEKKIALPSEPPPNLYSPHGRGALDFTP